MRVNKKMAIVKVKQNSRVKGKRKKLSRKYDSAWKEIIQQLFKDFLKFFFPKIYRAIDFSKEIHFLDKELREIDPVIKKGDRVADILVRATFKDNTTNYIFIVIHIEVQGQQQKDFMERMFVYYYRIFDKLREKKIPVISLALLTDNNENFRPDEYKFNLLGFLHRMKIPMVKIKDFETRDEMKKKLDASTNPMRMIVLAQLKSHQVKNAPNQEKFEVTKELIRLCYQFGYTRETIRYILRFFELVIRLPEMYNDLRKKVLYKIEEDKKMEYVLSFERSAERRGMRKGKIKGLEQGLEQGLEKGKIENSKEIAKSMLEDGFEINTVVKYTKLPVEEVLKLAPKGN